MYVYNNFCYGLDVNSTKDQELVDLLEDFDFCDGFEVPLSENEEEEIEFEVRTWYHGDSDASYYPGVVGFVITDDDHNPNYTQEVRQANEEVYKKAFENGFSLWLDLQDMDTFSNEEKKDFDTLLTKLKNMTPRFHTVEASS